MGNATVSSAPVLVLVSGFLGSGKTTLLLTAASRLRDSGIRVGLLTNDQGGELVDTRILAAYGFDTEEIAGGCFCCRFSEFVRSAERLLARAPDVIFAEAVGSCIDLCATVLQPLKRFHSASFRLAPLTVLVDPGRAAKLLGPAADPHLAYLFRHQIAEADQAWFTKADRYDAVPDIPGLPARRLSAYTGEGVSEWLDSVLSGGHNAGARLLDIDYREYAEAEAALGWLNWQASLLARQPLSPPAIAGPLLEQLDRRLTEAGVDIAHLKIFVQADTGYIKASICRNSEEPTVDGMLDASPARRHELILNLRARAAPDLLQSIVDEVTRNLPGRLKVRHAQCFRPAAPKPEHRLAEIL